jgi:rare lipoprotein A
MKKLVLGFAVASLMALTAKSEADSPFLPGPSPIVLPASHGEIGLASWYGGERQGKRTASGELFDMNKSSGAHAKLPFGTTVRVTNLKNRESALLHINDRGPGTSGRVIDVSWAAAKRLGFLEAGVTRVQIDVISDPVSCIRQPHGPQSSTVNFR